MSHDDQFSMTCRPIRDALSAMADGEAAGVDPRIVDAHVARCADCRQFRTITEQTRGLGAVGPAADMPDLSRRVTKLAAIADRASTWGTVRAVLAVVAVQILVFAVPDLAARDAIGTEAHDSRHLGAFAIAYAAALLVVVARPARARTVLPIACVLAGALVITAAVDLANGNVPFINETSHLPELISVGLVWALASPSRCGPRIDSRPGRPHLTVIDDNRREAG